METNEHIDLRLDICLETWRSLPAVEREIDEWNQEDAADYLATWGIQEVRLENLEQDARSAQMSEEQLRRYEELRRVVAENRPIIERLLLT